MKNIVLLYVFMYLFIWFVYKLFEFIPFDLNFYSTHPIYLDLQTAFIRNF